MGDLWCFIGPCCPHFARVMGPRRQYIMFQNTRSHHPTTHCHLPQLQALSVIVYCSACCNRNALESRQNTNVVTSCVPHLWIFYLFFCIQNSLYSLSAILAYIFWPVSFGSVERNVNLQSKERVCFTCHKTLSYSCVANMSHLKERACYTPVEAD